MVLALKLLQDQLADYEERYADMQANQDKAVEEAKAAAFECDRLAVREKQLVKEVERLEERLRKHRSQVEETVKSQVDTYIYLI